MSQRCSFYPLNHPPSVRFIMSQLGQLGIRAKKNFLNISLRLMGYIYLQRIEVTVIDPLDLI